jgi:hypothetical protein
MIYNTDLNFFLLCLVFLLFVILYGLQQELTHLTQHHNNMKTKNKIKVICDDRTVVVVVVRTCSIYC